MGKLTRKEQHEVNNLREQIMGAVRAMMNAAEDNPDTILHRFRWLLRTLHHLNAGKLDNMKRTYEIAVAINFTDDARHSVMEKVMRKLAQSAFAQANLISDGRTPQVSYKTEDVFLGTEELALLEKEEAEHKHS